jgi:hypothetical protein
MVRPRESSHGPKARRLNDISRLLHAWIFAPDWTGGFSESYGTGQASVYALGKSPGPEALV